MAGFAFEEAEEGHGYAHIPKYTLNVYAAQLGQAAGRDEMVRPRADLPAESELQEQAWRVVEQRGGRRSALGAQRPMRVQLVGSEGAAPLVAVPAPRRLRPTHSPLWSDS